MLNKLNTHNNELPKSLEGKWSLYQVVKPNLLLFSKKWTPYNEVFIVKNKNGRLFAYNKVWEKVYLPKSWIAYDKQYFYFQEVDGKYLLYVEYDGMWVYFDENGEKYTPKWIIKKMDEKSDKILKPLGNKIVKVLKPILDSLYNTLHTELIFPPRGNIKIHKQPENKSKINKFVNCKNKRKWTILNTERL